MSYVPSATFTPVPAFHSLHISEHARLGPVPSTDVECRQWLLAGLALSIAAFEKCDEVSSSHDDCDCESCFYHSAYCDQHDPAEQITAALERMSPNGLRAACKRLAANRSIYFQITYGAAHRCSDASMVAGILVERAPLSDASAELGTVDGSLVVVPCHVF